MLVLEPVQAAIWHCLNHYAYGDATFLAERLVSEVHSDETLFLLATCYYRSGKLNQAYDVLHAKGSRSPQNKFLMAKCCAELNRLSEAECLLSGGEALNPRKDSSTEDVVKEFGEAASFALQLLSGIYCRTERATKSADADRKALKLNPFLWRSFLDLCNKGEAPDPNKVFVATNLENFDQCHGSSTVINVVAAAAAAAGAAPTAQPLPPSSCGLYSTPSSLPSAAASSSTPLPSAAWAGGAALPTAIPNVCLETPILTKQQQPFLHTPTPGGGAGAFNANDNSDTNALCTPSLPSSHASSSAAAAAALLTSSSRFMSGLSALNCTADVSADGGSAGAATLAAANHQRCVGGGGGSAVGHYLMPPPVLPRRTARPVATSSAAAQAARNNCHLADRFGTPTFGVLPRGQIGFGCAGRLDLSSPGLGSLACRLEFSSPGVSILSPMLPPVAPAAYLGSGGSGGAATPESALTNATNTEQKIAKRSIMSSKENPLKPVLSHSSGNSSNSGNAASSAAHLSSSSAASTGNQIVRRSTRLFQSVKENATKAPSKRGAGGGGVGSDRAPKSPSRKTKTGRGSAAAAAARSSQQMQQAQAAEMEKNEKNKSDDLLKPSDALSAAGGCVVSGGGFLADKPRLQSSAPAAAAAAAVQMPSAAQLSAHALVIQKQSVEGLMCLLRQLGLAYGELSRFNCRKATALFEAVPTHHRHTGWVLGQIGKAHFELGNYKDAKRYFQEVREREPHRLENMEFYSTALWHLQEEVELSALSQELTRADKSSPEAWCAAGNCFSHQKEHENAIKFFQRAVQMNPTYAYAYTLLGHEYVAIEELDKALSCFRNAVRLDPRLYNAWYGVGTTYYKQERFQLAEIYYRKALAINPHNPTLMCHVAVVQHQLQKTDRALETLNAAIRMAPRNPLCKFERASILFASERYHEALEELNELKELVPKESPVYFLIGKVHNKLNNTHLALMHFSWAMDLDPKGASNSQIKDALDPTMNRAAQDADEQLAAGGGGGPAAPAEPADQQMPLNDAPPDAFADPPPAGVFGVVDVAAAQEELLDVTPPHNQQDESL